jgi:RNA polymerase sigma-32 factor
MAHALNLTLPSTAGSLETYIDAVNRIPLLPVEQEQELIVVTTWTRPTVSTAHLRFVVKVARGYSYGLAQPT